MLSPNGFRVADVGQQAVNSLIEDVIFWVVTVVDLALLVMFFQVLG